MNEIITHNLLKSWLPCKEGYKRFLELFPNGASLPDAVEGLVNDGHDDWGLWVFEKCKEQGLFTYYVSKGYRNSGDGNSGNWNSGNRNSGYSNSGCWNSGDRNSGYWNSGDRNSGYSNSGDGNLGSWNSGYRNSGDRNSGDWNSGYMNSGYWNSGNWNSGNMNSGDRNSGDGNSGYRNSGYSNSGCWNSGDRNSGYWNSGNWNSGNRNSGYFNIDKPKTIRVFGVDIKSEVFEKAYKPDFLYFDLCYWVDELNMTDQDKIDDPNFYVRGGQLRERRYKEAFKLSWDNSDKSDRIRIKDFPNFNKEMFFEITGINVDEE